MITCDADENKKTVEPVGGGKRQKRKVNKGVNIKEKDGAKYMIGHA